MFKTIKEAFRIYFRSRKDLGIVNPERYYISLRKAFKLANKLNKKT